MPQQLQKDLIANPVELQRVQDFFKTYKSIKDIVNNIDDIEKVYPVGDKHGTPLSNAYIIWIILGSVSASREYLPYNTSERLKSNIRQYLNKTRYYSMYNYSYNKIDLSEIPSNILKSVVPTNVYNAIKQQGKVPTRDIKGVQDNILSHKAFETSVKSLTGKQASAYLNTINSFKNTQELYLNTIMSKLKTVTKAFKKDLAYGIGKNNFKDNKSILNFTHSHDKSVEESLNNAKNCNAKYIYISHYTFKLLVNDLKLSMPEWFYTDRHSELPSVVGGLPDTDIKLTEDDFTIYTSYLKILVALNFKYGNSNITYFKPYIDYLVTIIKNDNNEELYQEYKINLQLELTTQQQLHKLL